MQVGDRRGQIFGESATSPIDAQNLSILAVATESLSTERARAAADVDLGDNPASYPTRVGSLLDNTDHLVARHTPKVAVTAEERMIGPANSRHPNPHQTVPGFRDGSGYLL